MGKMLRKAIDVQIQATEIVRKKGLDSFVEKIAAKIDEAAGEGKPECYVTFNDIDEVVLDQMINMLNQAGYETHLNYYDHALNIIWGYVKNKRKDV
nr:MAG TPA: putative tautomerase [Caudoviricetes sp.]